VGPRSFTASSYVAAQVKNIRIRRGWSQQKLADRLSELLAETPPWAELLYKKDPKDPRPRKPGAKKPPPKWTQTRVAKLERGVLKQITVDDLFELALALDVSPLYLLTPAPPPPERDRETRWSLLRPQENDVFNIALGGTVSRAARDVRQWIRGVQPLLGPGDYRTNEEATTGRRFYLFEAQSMSEWNLIRECGVLAERTGAFLGAFEPTADADEDDGAEQSAPKEGEGHAS
jgi:transcriptional regulator with XRE-family HTH domain